MRPTSDEAYASNPQVGMLVWPLILAGRAVAVVGGHGCLVRTRHTEIFTFTWAWGIMPSDPGAEGIDADAHE